MGKRGKTGSSAAWHKKRKAWLDHVDRSNKAKCGPVTVRFVDPATLKEPKQP